MYRGDIALGATLDFKFTTRSFSTGAPTTLAGTPSLAAYVDNGTTEITAGLTLSVDFDSVTGLNNVRVVASSGNGYAAGTNVQIVIAAGTVGGVSVVGEVVGEFSIEHRYTNVQAISGDATAADNAESFFDGTGYAGTNNVIPTVTNLTNLPSIPANWITAAGITDGAFTAAKFAAGAFDAVWSVATRILTAATNITSTGGTTVPQTGDSFARLGAPAGASVSADVAAVKSDTGTLVTRITATLFANITSLAEWLGLLAGKQAGDATALAEIRATGAGSGTFDPTTDSEEAIRDRGDAAWVTGPAVGDIADAVWDEAIAGHLGAGSTGAALNAAGSAGDPWSTALPGAYGAGTAGFIVGNNLDASVADVEADTQNIQSRLPAALTGGKMESNIGSITAGVIAAASFAVGAFDAVWTVGTRTLTSFGTLTTDTATAVWAAGTRTLTAFDASFKTGYALSAAGVQAIWDALTAALTTVGSIGKLIVDNLNATVASRATQADILSDATPFPGASVDATVSSRATPAQVNAEVVDALNVDTYAEPTGVPPATTTLVQKIGRLHMALRNGLTVTATDKTFLDDGGAAEWKKPLSDDGTTYTEGEGTTP